MCFNPRTIRVNTIVPHFGSYDVLEVPCGYCPACANAKRSAMLVRAYYEHRDSVYSYFDTLTYNDDNLPRVCGVPLFDRRHIQSFNKRLRIYIQRYLKRNFGIICKSPYTFLVAGEYGGDFGRPHYHIIFHLKVNINVHALKYLINLAWTYGFTDSYKNTDKHLIKRDVELFDTDFSNLPDERVVENINAIKYVVKYVFKDIASRKREKLAWDRYKVNFENVDAERSTALLSDFRRHKQFYQCSQHYGESLLGEIDYKDLLNRVVPYRDSKNLSHYVVLPRYYVNKIFKRVVEVGEHLVSVDTSFSAKHYRELVHARIIASAERFSRVLPLIGVDPSLAYNLAVYRCVYRGRYCNDFPHSPFTDYAINDFIDKSLFTAEIMSEYLADVGLRPVFILTDRLESFHELSSLLIRVEQKIRELDSVKENTAHSLEDSSSRLAKFHH